LLGIAEDTAALEEAGELMMEDYYSRLSEKTSEIENVTIETIKIESKMQAGDGNE